MDFDFDSSQANILQLQQLFIGGAHVELYSMFVQVYEKIKFE